MSSNKKKIPEDPPMFERDPINGQLIPLPLNWSSKKNLSSKKNRFRSIAFKDLKPLSSLGLTAADFEEPMEQPSKKRKVDVRRGLFNFPTKLQTVPSPVPNPTSVCRKIPSNRVRKELFTFTTPAVFLQRCTAGTNQSSIGKTKKTSQKNVLESSLLDLDEVHKFSSSPTDTMNFMELEEKFKNEEKEKEVESSPISSVCNLLKVTNINNYNTQSSCSKQEDSTKLIQDTISAQQKYFQDFEDSYQEIMKKMQLAFDEYKSKHEKNMELLNSKLNSATTPLKNKENDCNRINRRSIRLQKKSPLPTSKKLLVSPVLNKTENLLKSTLKKNVAARYGNESPRTREALLMYNTFRNNNGNILETPRMDRHALLQTPKSIDKKSLSWKVQRQCLLLQDTPPPK